MGLIAHTVMTSVQFRPVFPTNMKTFLRVRGRRRVCGTNTASKRFAEKRPDLRKNKPPWEEKRAAEISSRGTGATPYFEAKSLSKATTDQLQTDVYECPTHRSYPRSGIGGSDLFLALDALNEGKSGLSTSYRPLGSFLHREDCDFDHNSTNYLGLLINYVASVLDCKKLFCQIVDSV